MPPRYVSLAPLVPWRQAERPIDWAGRFGRHAPLELELGFGSGDYLVRRAAEHPERDFIGLELHWGLVQRGLRKIALCGTGNVRVVQADARDAMQRLFAPCSLSHAYALFACPWPKARHEKHRLFSSGFLRLLNSRLADGADVRIVTDHQPYEAWIRQEVDGTGFSLHVRPIAPQFDTRYERKWRLLGQERFYELRLVKTQPITIPVLEDAAVQTYRVKHLEPQRLHPASQHTPPTVDFKEQLYDPARRKLLARFVVAEDHLVQDVWLEVAWDGHEWHIRPAYGSSMIPTAGLQRALDLLKDAVEKSVDPNT